MISSLYPENNPSQNILLINNLIGKKVKKIIRYSLFTIDEATSKFDIAKKDFFSLTLGPLLIYFEDGLVIGISSSSLINSIVLWVEKNEIGEQIDSLTENDMEFIPISVRNENKFWQSFLNEKIKSIKLIY